jgi:molybdopterin-binding protein
MPTAQLSREWYVSKKSMGNILPPSLFIRFFFLRKEGKFYKILDIRLMNSFKGHIAKIEVSGALSLVTVSILEGTAFKAIVIDTPATASYLKEGELVSVLFKETEVVLGTDADHQISLQNSISGSVNKVDQGQLLSTLEITTTIGIIRSTISSGSLLKLGFKKGSTVRAMIKLNEIMLAP